MPLKQEREFNAAELMEFYKSVGGRMHVCVSACVCWLTLACPSAGPEAEGFSANHRGQFGVPRHL